MFHLGSVLRDIGTEPSRLCASGGVAIGPLNTGFGERVATRVTMADGEGKWRLWRGIIKTMRRLP
jgi:hypothetical protein